MWMGFCGTIQVIFIDLQKRYLQVKKLERKLRLMLSQSQKSFLTKNLKKTLQHFFKSYWPIFLLILFTCVFFWNIFILNQVALPADFLVHGSYPLKNPITTDSVSFISPISLVVIKNFKSIILPLFTP